MNPSVHIYKKMDPLHEALASVFKNASEKAWQTGSYFTVALSGGNTPQYLFEYLSSPEVSQKIKWEFLQFFWGDERCVSADHPDSNFGNTVKYLLSRVNFPEKNIHRIRGENDPHLEAVRYAEEISSSVRTRLNLIPRFDWILLGLGMDGHTASLFPGQSATGLCIVTTHPQTGQKRITMNFELLNHACRISFVVLGEKKAQMVAKIINGGNDSKNLPAGNIQPVKGECEWYLDEAAAAYL